MKMLPVRLVSLASDLVPGALAERLRTVVGGGPTLPFTGAVAAEGFVITRMNEYRSTFMPLVRGRLLASPAGGTTVLLRLRPPGTVVAFMGIWLAFLAAVGALILLAHTRDAGRSLLPLLAPAGLGAFSWYLMSAVFATDAHWAVEQLVETVPVLRRVATAGPPGTCTPLGASIGRMER